MKNKMGSKKHLRVAIDDNPDLKEQNQKTTYKVNGGLVSLHKMKKPFFKKFELEEQKHDPLQDTPHFLNICF